MRALASTSLARVVSTHAPVRARHAIADAVNALLWVSTHAPVRARPDWRDFGGRYDFGFNSRARKGATNNRRRPAHHNPSFNSRARKGATRGGVGARKPPQVSTHAPVRARPDRIHLFSDTRLVSTHAPVRARLEPLGNPSGETPRFNSRARKGATCAFGSPIWFATSFNSRARKGATSSTRFPSASSS